MTGEKSGQAGWPGSSETVSQEAEEAEFTSSSGTFARAKRERGTWRRGVIRSCSESNQVVQAGFGPGRIAVTQRVSGCYCASARCERLWRIHQKNETARRKPPKGGQKERARREGHGDSAGSVKTFQAPAMLKTTPLGCERKAT